MKKIIIYTISIFIFFTSCRKILNIEIPDNKKHIVINGIITPDSIIKINVSKSQSTLDNLPIQYLSNAKVKLYEDNAFIENLTYEDNGFFISTLKPKQNKNYKLITECEDLTPVSSKTKLPNKVEIKSIETDLEIENNSYDDYISQNYILNINLEINDNFNEDNFYMIAISTKKYEYDYSQDPAVIIDSIYTYDYFNTNDLIFKDNDFFSLNGIYGRVFTDEIFNGKTYFVDLAYYIYFDSTPDNPYNYLDKDIAISLISITEDIYKYITSYNLNDISEYDPFAQPVQVYTNIENGLGIFSSYTLDSDTITVSMPN